MKHAPLSTDQLQMLQSIQRDSFGYFIHEVNEANGLVADKTAPNWPASIAAVGMALTAYPIGVERGLMTRERALQRTLTTLRFFMASDQGESPTASGHRGFYYHFLDLQTGARAWNCELSSIDTALLIAGVLTAAEYFRADNAAERELRELADALYRRIDWAWMCNGDAALRHGWKPEGGFLPWHWQGYDEAMILYLLAIGSPTHPLPPQAWQTWLATCTWQTVEGIEYLHAGPLFIHQMSHVWIDFRGLRDAFMRSHDSDYFENSRRAAQVQQRYAIRNPKQLAMYGEFGWGITASDGPGATKRGRSVEGRTYYDYIARGVPQGPDDGTLAPWAVVASLPFAPDIVLPTIEHYQRLQLHVGNRYGFKASFNASFPADRRHPVVGWVSQHHFGINEGPTVMMIENHLSGLVWRLMRGCAPIVTGLQRAGFEGGWLTTPG
ncbi:MAG: glucoamylase family protein [Burkholderiales bacterium]